GGSGVRAPRAVGPQPHDAWRRAHPHRAARAAGLRPGGDVLGADAQLRADLSAVPITVASLRPRPSARLSVCGIRLAALRACVLDLLGSRPGAIGAQSK